MGDLAPGAQSTTCTCRQGRRQVKLGHDFDLSGSRDVIDDVIIRSAMGHFLLVGNWFQVSNSTVFEIFASKY